MIDRWRDLTKNFINIHKAQSGWSKADYTVFFEVETLLWVAEALIPDSIQRPLRDLWTLISGYCVTGLNDSIEARQICLTLRQRLSYLDSPAAWASKLKWYKDQPESIRLYSLSQMPNGEWTAKRRTYTPDAHTRVDAYHAACQPESLDEERTPMPWATAGTYHFKVPRETGDVLVETITITPALAEKAHTPTPKQALPVRNTHPPISVTMTDLLDTAHWLDEQEVALDLKQNGWGKRINNLELAMALSDGSYQVGASFTLSGLFHLVGMLGAGKSSLITVLTVYLALRGYHVSAVMTTVVETFRFAQWLRQIGVNAAPLLGRNRADHVRKFGMAEAEALSEERLFVRNKRHPPAVDWLVAPCAISGSLSDAIPRGKEPCESLKQTDKDGREINHRCPFKPICPVHRVSREAVNAQVWVMNPQSLLYSAAPDGVGDKPTRLLEAVYRMSDVLIVDEADSVQVRWDTALAPSTPVVGSDDALLDWLREKLTTQSGGRKRTRSAEATFNRLSNLADQANILANHAYRLLGKKYKGLKSWVSGHQLTQSGLNRRISEWLVKALIAPTEPLERQTQIEALMEELHPALKGVSDPALGALNGWVDRLLANPISDKSLTRDVRDWLSERFNLSAKHKKMAKAIHRLDMALTLAALMYRFNQIISQATWIDREFGTFPGGDILPSQTIRALMPAPPLDNPLGMRLVSRGADDIGAFYMHQSAGMGRWLLINLPRLYLDQRGWVGPHVLLTSATSWLPQSTQFNLACPSNAILKPVSLSTPVIRLEYYPVQKNNKPLKISGAGSEGRKHNNLRDMVTRLAEGKDSKLAMELRHWETIDPAQKRRIILVVNSYAHCQTVLETLETIPAFKGRVLSLVSDDVAPDDPAYIQTRKVESLREYEAEILIAPLMAIQRGFNILDEQNQALLGSVFFLVRPYPPPDDLGQHVLAVNDWLMQRLEPDGRTLHGSKTLGTLRSVRQAAMGMWNRRLRTRTFSGMDADIYAAFLRDHFVPIWQTIGRLIRGGKDARVFFVDGAFAPTEGERHLLRDWYAMLKGLRADTDPTTAALTSALYADAIQAFDRAMTDKRLE